jgi:hypothetical protein
MVAPWFLVTATENATPILFLDFKRPPGNFHQGLVPLATQCLLGQNPRGGVTGDRDFPRRQEELSKPQADSRTMWARKHQYLGLSQNQVSLGGRPLRVLR